MRILVIGGTGFIGRFIVGRLIADGHDVAVLHRGRTHHPITSAAAHITGDRRRLGEHGQALRALAPDVVIDMVLSSGAQARAMMDVFRGVARRIVAVSSMDVYRAAGVLHDLEPGGLEPLPLTETSPLRSRLQTYPPEQIERLKDVFGWLDDEYDKIPVEQAVLDGGEAEGCVLRLPMVYGPGDPLNRFGALLQRMDADSAQIVFEEQEARWRGTRGYVENVADAVALAAVSDRAAGRVYNVGEADVLTELDWARAVARLTGWNGELLVVPAGSGAEHTRMQGNLDQHWVADTSRIREELGYRESIDREEGLRRTIEWSRGSAESRR